MTEFKGVSMRKRMEWQYNATLRSHSCSADRPLRVAVVVEPRRAERYAWNAGTTDKSAQGRSWSLRRAKRAAERALARLCAPA